MMIFVQNQQIVPFRKGVYGVEQVASRASLAHKLYLSGSYKCID